MKFNKNKYKVLHLRGSNKKRMWIQCREQLAWLNTMDLGSQCTANRI